MEVIKKFEISLFDVNIIDDTCYYFYLGNNFIYNYTEDKIQAIMPEILQLPYIEGSFGTVNNDDIKKVFIDT